MSRHVVRKLARGEELSAVDERHAASCAQCSLAIADSRTLDEWLTAAAASFADAPLPEGVLQDRLTSGRLTSGPSMLAWTPVVAVILIVAAAVGFGISSGLPRIVPRPSSSPVGPSPSATQLRSPSPGVSPSASPPVQPLTAIRAGLIAGPGDCRNGNEGFALDVPSGWYANAATSGTAACRFFAPMQFDPLAGSSSAAIETFVVEGDISQAESIMESKKVLERNAVELDGHPAVRIHGRSGGGERLGFLIALDAAASVDVAHRFLVVATKPVSAAFQRDSAALEQIVTGFGSFPAFVLAPAVAAEVDDLFSETTACSNGRYAVSYPATWEEVGDCAGFRPQAGAKTETASNDAAISISIFDGAIGYLTPTIASEDLSVGGYPARRVESEAWPAAWGPDGEPQTYQYVVYLGPTPEFGPNLIASTSDLGNDYSLHKAVLDRLMASLRIGLDQEPDFASVSDSDLDAGSLVRVASGNGELVAGGQVCAADFTCKAAIWRSFDGRAWSPPQFLLGAGPNGVSSISYAGDMWIALSDGVWYSSDAVTWREANGDFTDGQGDGGPTYSAEGGCCSAGVMAVTRTRSGFVAVGGVECFKCRGRAAVWRSSDGHSWMRVRYEEAFEGSAMQSVFLMPTGRLVAIGGQLVWTSNDDGQSWDVQTVFPSESTISSMTTEDESLLAISSDAFRDVGTVWTSTDGVSWKAVPLAGLSHAEVLTMAELNGAMYLAVENWTNVPETSHELLRLTSSTELESATVDGGSAASISGMAPINGQIVAVGHIDDIPGGTVWLGR
jgi:hypothetical protein